MPRVSFDGWLRYAALFLAACLWYSIHTFAGQTEGVRFFGIALLAYTLLRLARPALRTKFITSSRPGEGSFRHWVVLFATLALGTALTVFPHEVACAVGLRGYACE